MKRCALKLRDGLTALGMVFLAFVVNLLLTAAFGTRGNIESVFILAVFLVSWRTDGYFWGVASSLVSVLLVNYTFTYPYWAFDLVSPARIAGAAVMLIVAVMTSTLTTKLKQQEKMKAEAERERMRGNLLRAVSHDLRTPLTSIYGACSALRENLDELPKERQKKMLKDVCADAQWLVRMVENLLSVTRVDADQVRLSKRDVVLEELIDAVVVKFRKHYPDQTVELDLPEEFVTVPMDAILIEQVLMNLLENAVFHAENRKHIWLRVEVQGNEAVFYVEDDGQGIPEDRLEGLFSGSLGRRTSADTSRSSMGIGLSVCKTILEAHGGEIFAGNRPGGGAQFRFTLKMEEPYGEQ